MPKFDKQTIIDMWQARIDEATNKYEAAKTSYPIELAAWREEAATDILMKIDAYEGHTSLTVKPPPQTPTQPYIGNYESIIKNIKARPGDVITLTPTEAERYVK